VCTVIKRVASSRCWRRRTGKLAGNLFDVANYEKRLRTATISEGACKTDENETAELSWYTPVRVVRRQNKRDDFLGNAVGQGAARTMGLSRAGCLGLLLAAAVVRATAVVLTVTGPESTRSPMPGDNCSPNDVYRQTTELVNITLRRPTSQIVVDVWLNVQVRIQVSCSFARFIHRSYWVTDIFIFRFLFQQTKSLKLCFLGHSSSYTYLNSWLVILEVVKIRHFCDLKIVKIRLNSETAQHSPPAHVRLTIVLEMTFCVERDVKLHALTHSLTLLCNSSVI